jgi:ankyrin repeat protein
MVLGTSLHWAVFSRPEAVVQLLKHWPIDLEDEKKQTALYWAADIGNKAVVQQLLEHGANVEVKSNIEETALHIAAKYRNDAVVQLLLEHKADVNTKDTDRCTALKLAIL